MDRAFVDTSAWYALVNRADPAHAKVSHALQAKSGRLLTSNYVFDEALTLCRYRLSLSVACKVGEVLLNPATVSLVQVEPRDQIRAWQLFQQRLDQKYSFTDCTSFELMRRLELRSVICIDRDFTVEGFHVEP